MKSGEAVKNIPVGASKLYDPEYEKKYDLTHHDVAGLMIDSPGMLYILHGCDGGEEGELVMTYVLNYEDGKKAELKVVAGNNIGSVARNNNLPDAIAAGNGLYLTAWPNPRPGKKMRNHYR